MLELLRRLWIGWNAALRGFLTAQSRFLMAVTWIAGVAPVSIVLRLVGRRFLDRAPADRNASSYRVTRTTAPLDMKRASRMF